MTANIACRESDAEAALANAASAAAMDLVWDLPFHGALTRADAARKLGQAEFLTALEDRTWVELWSGVVVPEPRVRDPLTRAAAALLRAGPPAVLSGATAAAMHGCTAAESTTTHITVPYDRQMRSLPGLSVRQAWIQESEVVELDGLRVHALDVALAELLCTGPQRMALACLEQALGRFGGADAEHFRGVVGERIARRRDRRGTRQAAALLELAWADPPLPRPSEQDCAQAPSAISAARVGGQS